MTTQRLASAYPAPDSTCVQSASTRKFPDRFWLMSQSYIKLMTARYFGRIGHPDIA